MTNDEPQEVHNGSDPVRVFISHVHRDNDLAEAFSKLLRSLSAGFIECFRSDDVDGFDGIKFGEQWYPVIMKKLENTSVVVCLLTDLSMVPPWILFEAGVGQGARGRKKVLGLAFDVQLDAIKGPLGQLENCYCNVKSVTKLAIELLNEIPGAKPDRDAVEARVQTFCSEVQDILNARKEMSLVPQRGSIPLEQYERYYGTARQIRVSGIALTQFIKIICEATKGDDLPDSHLIKILSKNDVSVKMLMANPTSSSARERQETENNPNLPGDIDDNLEALRNLKAQLGEAEATGQVIEGSIEVKLCDEEQQYAMVIFDPLEPAADGRLYLGLLLPGIRGDQSPTIRVRNVDPEKQLYKGLSDYFDDLYQNAHLFFEWEGDHCEIHEVQPPAS